MSNVDEILKKLNINDVEYEFGLDVKKKNLEREIERKTKPSEYVEKSQQYFNSLVTPGSIKALIKNVYDDAGDNLSQTDLKKLVEKSVKERIKYAQDATESAFPNSKSTLNNLVYNNKMSTFLKSSTTSKPKKRKTTTTKKKKTTKKK
jgi:hypothetical protein